MKKQQKERQVETQFTTKIDEKTSLDKWKRSGNKRKDRLKLSLPPKLMKKLVWVPVSYFCFLKFFILSYVF